MRSAGGRFGVLHNVLLSIWYNHESFFYTLPISICQEGHRVRKPMTSRVPDASLERRAFLSPSSPHSNDARSPSSVQTRARKASNSSRHLPLHWIAGLVGLVGLVIVVSLLYATGSSSRTSLRDESKALELQDAYNTPRRLARFEVNQSSLDNLATVAVSFEYKAPQPKFFGRDRVAAYCVSAADERANRTPSVQEFMDTVHTNGKSSGVVEVGPLVNMRCSWLLKFITRDDQVLAETKLLRFKHGPTQPLQIHLALTERTDEMRVKWVSDNITNPVVVFGEDKGKLESVGRAKQSSYKAKDMCNGPATTVFPRNYRDPGQIFDAVMTNLKAGKRYFYQVGDEKGERSDVLEFRMPPAAGSNSVETDAKGSSMSFFVYGDLNTPVGATDDFAEDTGNCGTTMQLIREDMERADADPSEHRYVVALHVGDLAYAMGSTYIWDQFGHLIEYAAARLPYMISMGNHDYGYLEGVTKDHMKWPAHRTFEEDGTHGHDSYGECGVPSEKRFHMPENGNGLYWYSFDTGLAHHTVISSEHEFARGSPLHNWLVNDLKSVDRSKTPWLFVYIHRPLYCSVAYSGDYYRSLLFRDQLEQELADYHVDIVFAGHYHSYERTCAVFGDRCIESPSGKAMAPVHLMVGSGGYRVDDAGFYRSRWREQGFLEHGYGRVHIYNSTHLHFEFVSDVERRVKDETWIVSTHDWPSNRERYPPGYFPPQDIAGFAAVVLLGLLASYAVVVPAIRRARNSKYMPVPPIQFS